MLLSLALSVWVAWTLHVFLVYSLLALGDLVHHVWRVERALTADDLTAARSAVAQLVVRDTDRMDAAACRRASIESLSENLTDGFASALFWYALLGIPGLVLFKVVSTMDSMVGFKTPQYLRFGWCGARLDDVMNYLPARLTWLLIVLVAAVLPTYSARKAFAIGISQNALFPSPNSGWSEAATAGAIQRRLVGPVWMNSKLVTDLWVGDPRDPAAATHDDATRAIILIIAAGLLVAILAGSALLLVW
jgi:adenosylcobinamide-phosphate synthase